MSKVCAKTMGSGIFFLKVTLKVRVIIVKPLTMHAKKLFNGFLPFFFIYKNRDKPGTVRVNDPLLLISLDLDELDIHRYTDR
jgi:hypothetical protein